MKLLMIICYLLTLSLEVYAIEGESWVRLKTTPEYLDYDLNKGIVKFPKFARFTHKSGEAASLSKIEQYNFCRERYVYLLEHIKAYSRDNDKTSNEIEERLKGVSKFCQEEGSAIKARQIWECFGGFDKFFTKSKGTQSWQGLEIPLNVFPFAFDKFKSEESFHLTFSRGEVLRFCEKHHEDFKEELECAGNLEKYYDHLFSEVSFLNDEYLVRSRMPGIYVNESIMEFKELDTGKVKYHGKVWSPSYADESLALCTDPKFKMKVKDLLTSDSKCHKIRFNYAYKNLLKIVNEEERNSGPGGEEDSF